MKLFLSSFRLGKSPERLAELAAGKGPAAFIANALDCISDKQVKEKVINRGIDDLKDIGFESQVIDLRDYFESTEKLRNVLADYRFIFVTGGNAFILRRALKMSGMDTLLQEMRNDQDVLYAGYSAGACVAGPTMKGLQLVDDAEEVPDGYSPEVIWDGLSLIGHNIAPHYRSDHPESKAINEVIRNWIENKILFKALRDGEVLIADSSSYGVTK
jgi:dipeptidase E